MLVVTPEQSRIAPLVSTLEPRLQPAAVIGRVVGPDIMTFDGVFRAGFWPHVSQKGCKISAPSVADSNAQRTIPLVSTRARIVAAALHGTPRAVLRAARADVLARCMTVRSHRFGNALNAVATAGYDSAQSQVGRSDSRGSTAIATASDITATVVGRRIGNNDKPAEPLTHDWLSDTDHESTISGRNRVWWVFSRPPSGYA